MRSGRSHRAEWHGSITLTPCELKATVEGSHDRNYDLSWVEGRARTKEHGTSLEAFGMTEGKHELARRW